MMPSPGCHVLRNARGMRVMVNAVDASLAAWWAPDRYGRQADVLATLAAAPAQSACPVSWQCEAAGENTLALRLARDGLCVRLRYRLEEDGALRIDCEAVAIAAARVNLAAPSFNLYGGGGVGDHVLRLAADRYLAPASASVVAEVAAEVAGSAFDFRQAAPLGARLAWPGVRAAGVQGFNHGFCLRGDGLLHEAARVADPASGRELRFFTTQPQLHLHSDASRFCLASQVLDVPSGAPAHHTVIYRLGLQDIDGFEISKKVSML